MELERRETSGGRGEALSFADLSTVATMDASGTTDSDGSDYTLLKDLKWKIEEEAGTFSLCLWIYLNTSGTPLPIIIIQQAHSDTSSSVPFLALNKEKHMMLFPLLFLHKEAPDQENSASLTEIPCACSEIEFPTDKWVHVGCEVSADFMRLHIDGEVVGMKAVTSLRNCDSNSNPLQKVTLSSVDNELNCYVHKANVLPLSSSIKDHYIKDPPLQLSIDSSCASEIEEGSDGVWSIVGGKASCRRNFSLDVILSDAFGQPMNKELEVFSSLLYDDNGTPVEKPNDAEAPLLTSYDGIEFTSFDRPSKLLQGRASFKLKISQLSSKCDNRLFKIKFDIPKLGSYPFLEVFSHPIRCISRNRNTRTPSTVLKKSTLLVNKCNGLEEKSSEVKSNPVHEGKSFPPQKRVKLGLEKSASTLTANPLLFHRPDEEGNSHAFNDNQVEVMSTTSLEGKRETIEETENSLSDSGSVEAKNSASEVMASERNLISDLSIFKYCLGGLNERSLMLKEITPSASDQDMDNFSQQISLYSGCLHHRHQIMISKRLIEEGTKAWALISQNNDHIHWENIIYEVEEQFMKIACCNSRSLAHQDFELLRRIAGCWDYITKENFEKMWCWLYPVAFTLSKDWINKLWTSTSPKWIEGFITKEEAEASLYGTTGPQEPGTFILRFPTSRSWPHPDAGSLVVTFIGTDNAVHHRLLSLDYIYSCGGREMNVKPLQDMLLAEPELSRLGRTVRSH